MNKKTIMTMLVAGALSVSALSTTAVFAEDAVVNENTPAVTETTTSTYQPEYKQLTDTWTGNNDIVFEVDGKGGFFYVDSIEPFDSNGDGSTYLNSTIQPKVELDANGKGKITFSSDAIKKAKYYYHAEEVNQLDWTKVDTIAISMGFRKGTYITGETFYVPIKLDASETTTPEKPSEPTTPSKPSESTTPSKASDDKGTTTITPNAPAAKDDKKTNTTTTTKKEAPKTGDTMNIALYASLLLVSALAAVVLTTKKRITE